MKGAWVPPVRRQPSRRRSPDERERDVTVCVASLFCWNYANDGEPPDVGRVAVTISDRMISAGDVEYQPNQFKMGTLAPHVLLLVTGDYSTHSAAIKAVQDTVKGSSTYRPQDIAQLYGAAIQAVKRKEAEDVILAPLGLNTDSFIAQQREMQDSFVSSLKLDLQGYQGQEVAALIVGMEADEAHLYEIESNGTVRCLTEVGFAAIGSGAWHAKAGLMRARYTKTWTFLPALAITFAAKKAAEVAPGVGDETDIFLLLRSGPEPLLPKTFEKLKKIYAEYNEANTKLVAESIEKLRDSLREPQPQAANESQAALPTPAQTAVGAGNSDAQGSGVETSIEHGAKGSDPIQGKEP